MKTIALLPFKNEEQFLTTYLWNVAPVVDEIICVDDGSTDGSLDLLNRLNPTPRVENKIKIYKGEELEVRAEGENRAGWPEIPNRIKLFNLGRDHGGTHFVNLDADETFTNNFLPNGRNIIEMLKPGEKISLRWLSMWGSPTHFRWDRSVWSNNYGVFIEADDGTIYDSSNDGSGMHVPRCISKGQTYSFNVHIGAVLHYQFTFLNTFWIKQAWYMCSELIIRGREEADVINKKYGAAFDTDIAYNELPPKWTNKIPLPDKPTYDENWNPESYLRPDYLPRILGWFDEYGPEYFEPLVIWFVPPLKAEFERRMGRTPNGCDGFEIPKNDSVAMPSKEDFLDD